MENRQTDCGWRFPEKPRTAGLCGRAAGACDCGPLSCAFIERVNKGRKPPKGGMAGWESPIPKGSVPHRRSGIHRAFSHIAHKRRNIRFKGLRRVHTCLRQQDRTQRLTRRNTGRFGWGVVSLPSERFARFGNPARPGLKTANFAAFGSWPGALSKNAESLRDSDALMRVAVTRRRGPAGLRDPIAVSLITPMGFTVLADRDYRVRKKAHFVFMRRAALPALPAPSAALLYALMH